MALTCSHCGLVANNATQVIDFGMAFYPPIGGALFCKHCNPSLQAKEEEMILDCVSGFTYGCDPEVFIKNDKGVYVSAAGLLPGTKDSPHKVEGGAVQVDGMAGEFNIDPASSFEEFNSRITGVMKQMKDMLPKGYTLDCVSAVTFDPEIFDGAPDEAKELGCSPDFNAWTGEINPPPHDPENPYLRTASGHLHVGWTEDAGLDDPQHLMNCRDLVKQFDWYLGAWSTKTDTDPTRRRLYGKAGACRYKPYGVEYRVLSNFWLTSKDRRLAVWNRMQQAVNDMRKSFIPDYMEGTDVNQRIVAAIDSTVQPGADLLSTYRYPLTTLDRSYARF